MFNAERRLRERTANDSARRLPPPILLSLSLSLALSKLENFQSLFLLACLLACLLAWLMIQTPLPSCFLAFLPLQKCANC